jgi:hypothetical protein
MPKASNGIIKRIPDWEYQRRVGTKWEPGFIGAEVYTEPAPTVDDSTDTDGDYSDSPENTASSERDLRMIVRMSVGLKISDVSFMERALVRLGHEKLKEVYKETLDVEKSGGLLTSDGARKRTPKGVFVQVLKKHVSREDVDYIIDFHPVTESTNTKKTVTYADGTNANDNEREIAPDDPRAPLVQEILVELEQLRVAETDWEIVRGLVRNKGEELTRAAFEKVRRRLNRGKWNDSPGQLFARIIKNDSRVSNEDLNDVFAPARTKQNQRSALVTSGKKKFTDVSLSQKRRLTPAEERCVVDVVLGLALAGLTPADISIIERILIRLGDETAYRMLERTKEIEAEGGQMTRDGLRRKTPGGVYLSLLTTEEQVSKEDLKYIFERANKRRDKTDRRKEDSHYAPSLFTPMNPFRVVDSCGKEPEFIEKLKAMLRPTLASLEFIPAVDPRLETVIRGVVLVGPNAINLIDRCVFALGEKKTEVLLETTQAKVLSGDISKRSIPEIYTDLVKAEGGLPGGYRLDVVVGYRS